MIRFYLNGAAVAADATEDTPLSVILRDHLGETGTKTGCAIGRCGACMVLLEGAAVNGCLIMGWQIAGRQITTIEGLPALPVGAALIRGMTEENAFQCGFCAPGVMMALAGLLTADPHADAEAVQTALEGNICRCTGYHSILRGAARAIALLNQEA